MQTGFWASVVAWFEATVSSYWTAAKAEASVIEGDIVTAIKNIEPEVMAEFDNLFGQLRTYAVQAAGEVEQAALNGDLLDSEKRSALIAKLLQAAESLGYSVGSQGLQAALGFLAEFGVSVMQMILGQSVKK